MKEKEFGMPSRSAVIDVGSASLILSVFEGKSLIYENVIPWGSISVLERGELSNKAVEFLEKTLDHLFELAGHLGAENIKVLATGIFRTTGNGKNMLKRICERYGVKWKILSPDEEAFLSYSACMEDFGEDIIVADVGGNSVEVCDYGEFIYSKEYGARVISKEFGMIPPVSMREIDDCVKKLSTAFSHIPRASRFVTVGSVGVLSSLFIEGLTDYCDCVHGTYIDRVSIEDNLEKVRKMKINEIEAVGKAFEGRGSLFLAGMVILRALLDAFGFEGFLVSTKGFRHGVMIIENWR